MVELRVSGGVLVGFGVVGGWNIDEALYSRIFAILLYVRRVDEWKPQQIWIDGCSPETRMKFGWMSAVKIENYNKYRLDLIEAFTPRCRTAVVRYLSWFVYLSASPVSLPVAVYRRKVVLFILTLLHQKSARGHKSSFR